MKNKRTTPDSADAMVEATKMPVWQLIVVYPTLFVAILGALPTASKFVESLVLPGPISINEVDNVKEQVELLKANFLCSQKVPNDFLKKHGNFSIGAIVCDSGDIVIVAQDAHNSSYPNPYIVPFKKVVSKGDTALASALGSLLPVSSVYAGPLQLPASPSTTITSEVQTGHVICQRLQDGVILLLRIQAPDGRFIYVVSNVYSREIVKQTPAPCTPAC
jgi:hypothetical protein